MSATDRKSPKESNYTRVPILRPEQIDKLNSLNLKLEKKEWESTIKSSLKTRGDELTPTEAKNRCEHSKEFADFFKNNIQQSKDRKSQFDNKKLNKSDKMSKYDWKKSNSCLPKKENNYIEIQGEELSAMVCCSMFQSRNSIKDNPFLVARMGMAHK